MDFTFESVCKDLKIFNGHTIDMQSCSWCDPWVIGLICLKAIEYRDFPDKQLLLPKNKDILSYLKRMHFDPFLEELTYTDFLDPLRKIKVNEKDNPGVHEIMHCNFRDEFNARLSSKIIRMFTSFGMSPEDVSRTTALVGEMGNNVFDHNEGAWPTNVRGAIILAQHFPTKNLTEVVVADPGIGFLGSLKASNPDLTENVNAILLGLSGVSGRVGEKRGNGLKVIQDWTLNKFDGIVKVQSGDGLVVVDKDGKHSSVVEPILGTLVSFVIKYK
jgi:hypothetical protein